MGIKVRKSWRVGFSSPGTRCNALYAGVPRVQRCGSASTVRLKPPVVRRFASNVEPRAGLDVAPRLGSRSRTASFGAAVIALLLSIKGHPVGGLQSCHRAGSQAGSTTGGGDRGRSGRHLGIERRGLCGVPHVRLGGERIDTWISTGMLPVGSGCGFIASSPRRRPLRFAAALGNR